MQVLIEEYKIDDFFRKDTIPDKIKNKLVFTFCIKFSRFSDVMI
mgnify:CR=1 FL=1